MSTQESRPKAQSYNVFQIFLHWAIAALIVANYFISEGMGHMLDQHIDNPTSSPSWVGDFHVYVGVTVLSLVVIRLLVRLFSTAPELKSSGNSTLDKLSKWVHHTLYLLMFLVPALGATCWFLKIDALGDIHVITMNIMMSLILLHAFAALFHQYVLKDDLILRMLGRS